MFSLFLIILSSWNPFIGPGPVPAQQDDVTETASPTTTLTLPPPESITPPVSETPSFRITETLTPTIVPSAITEPGATDLPPTVTLSGDFVSDEILIRFRRNASKSAIESCIQTADAFILDEINELAVFRLQVPDGRAAEAITRLTVCPGVRYVEPNYRVYIADTIPSDPHWNLQYGLINIRAPQGWDLSTGSQSVTIAILDSGVDLGHLDLAGKLVPGYDFVNNDASPQDDNGHGTHVAGIAAAASNNAVGIAGVSWGARIMPVKVLNVAGNGTFANVAAGIIWATDHGAQVINLSLGGNNPSQILLDAIDYAASRGVVLVAATGNAGSNFVLYPARYPQVIAVGATNSSNAHAGFSNYGPEVDLAAPGESIYSTLVGGYGYSSGTSMSAPFVSGLAAILRGIPGNGSPGLIAFQMESTALDIGPPGIDEFHGHGLIQIDAAMRAALSASTATSTSTGGILPTMTSTSTNTPPPVSGGGGATVTMPPIGFDPSATPVVPSPPSGPATISPTPATTGTSSAVATESPEMFALNTPTPGPPNRSQDWLIPCLGSFLILLGIFLFWMARSSSRSFGKPGRFK